MKQKERFKLLFSALIIILMTFAFSLVNTCQAASYKTYEISKKTKPQSGYEKLSTYNKYTKDYYLIRSFLETLEKQGGGTLYLKKGTYTISNALYIPNNVTVRLEKGVVLKKGNKTGTKKFDPSGSIFSFCLTSKKDREGSVSKYNGVKNAKLIGEGNPVIDLDYVKDAIGVIVGHNPNIEIKGIVFKNMKSGHFIEMDASKNVKVTKCKFMNHKDSENNVKEAINIDTPDKNTKGFNVKWSAQDKTPNINVTIQNCTFKNLERAIGTHKYSENKYHSQIKILNNTIDGCDNDAIRVMNWKDFQIENNTIKNVGKMSDGKRGILLSGASKFSVINNTFDKVSRPMQFIAWKNSGPGSQYKTTYNIVTKEEKKQLTNNIFKNLDEFMIRINKVYNEYTKDTEKIYL